MAPLRSESCVRSGPLGAVRARFTTRSAGGRGEPLRMGGSKTGAEGAPARSQGPDLLPSREQLEPFELRAFQTDQVFRGLQALHRTGGATWAPIRLMRSGEGFNAISRTKRSLPRSGRSS